MRAVVQRVSIESVDAGQVRIAIREMMQVSLANEGPITILLDTERLF